MGRRSFVLAFLLAHAACHSLPAEHVVVDRVEPGGTAARAGIQPGDLLLRWERGSSGGALRAPADLRRPEREESPLGAVTLHGRRGRREIAFTLKSDDWLLEARAAKAPGPAEEGSTGPLETAWRHAEQGALHLREGPDLARARAEWQRARELAESVSPDNLLVARAYNGLGAVAQLQGELQAAEAFYRRALRLAAARDEESRIALTALANLGAALRQRGDYAEGEAHLRRALAIHERNDPDGEEAAHALNSLGVLAKDRGDLEQAASFYERALAIHERRSPGSLRLAGLLNNLGNLARQRGDLPAAEAHHRRALAIREALSPASLDVAASLHNLGQVALDRGHWDEAESWLRRALERKQALAPASPALTNTLLALGDLALQRGDPAAARAPYQQALALRSRLMPDSASEAEAWGAWGEWHRRAGRTAEALSAWRRAASALEAQRGRLGGDHDVRVGFSAQHAARFQELMELLVSSGHPAEALHVLERSRARALLEMLAERDLAFTADVPAELAQERLRLESEHDRVQSELAGSSASRDSSRVESLLGRLRALRGEREALAAHVRAAAPRLASLQYPRPLDLAGARRALDPGTVLVAFAVGRSETLVFVVRPPGAGNGLTVHRRPLGEDELRRRVSAFRGLIERGRDAPALEPALLAQAHHLYRELLGPAAADLAAAQRMVLVPDGALHSLPFAALSPEPGRFLVEGPPLHVVLSATLYAELHRARGHRGREGYLMAFGDPRYPPGDRRLPSLQASRQEVQEIAGLFGSGARVALGEQATEERALEEGRAARYLHFAVHGLVDRRLPLDSALALATPERAVEGRANGLLQAWEVFEKMRLDAELVTLSACETGLGREMAGEGLVGLVRAFHYAGAPSVVASLWWVADRSTADLMVRFYAGLQRGLTKDEALRQAQAGLARSGVHPFHWAAFQLHGDWR
jgi:CHAT domain-containing protein/Tfp pilus assembly protein PilF